MTGHKTFSGMTRAAEKLIAELGARTIEDDRDYRETSRKVNDLIAELNGFWSNPADVDDAARLKVRLVEAFDAAMA